MPDLIAIADLRTITQLGDNVEERRMKAGIEDAHREVRKVLGRTGYDIVYAAAPSFSSMDAKYTTLLGTYLKPFMAWRAKQYSYGDNVAEIDKTGVFSRSGEDYSTVSDKTLSLLIAQARTRAEDRLEDLLWYLEENRATFTWYDTTVDGEERQTTQTSVGGFVMRRARKQDPYRG